MGVPIAPKPCGCWPTPSFLRFWGLPAEVTMEQLSAVIFHCSGVFLINLLEAKQKPWRRARLTPSWCRCLCRLRLWTTFVPILEPAPYLELADSHRPKRCFQISDDKYKRKTPLWICIYVDFTLQTPPPGQTE